ncbi:crotonase/enoyl-CoA hydratase family protein [Sphingobium sp. CR28]|uniref:crotonase/enoyl-CoA hydratase family protein n=1 Tax=Sphingobium sp. CR28 TaxID=3400272 RepID=UPI003FF0113E
MDGNAFERVDEPLGSLTIAQEMNEHPAGVVVNFGSLGNHPENQLAHGFDPAGKTGLFDLGQINVHFEEELNCLWAFITPEDRPNYNMGLLRDTMRWQDEAKRHFSARPEALKFMVLGSRFPGIFNLGGDLNMFADCIERQDRATLRHYGHLCVEIVEKVWHSNHMPVISIGLAQGDALGGGFEALLCFDVIVAERQARFGLPEILFGLFPGMGAYSILSRRIGHAQTEKMLLSGKVFSAEEMYEMGLVTVLAEQGEGEQAVRDYIAQTAPRHAGTVGIFQAGRRVNPMTLEELRDIVDGWVEAALRLSPADLRMMRRLARAQLRLGAH